MKQVRILVATPLYPPEIGGPATYCKILEEELPQYGIDVVTIPFSQVKKYPKILRHIIYCYKLLMQTRNVDVVFALDPVSTGLAAYVAAKITHKTFIVKIVGDYAWEQGTQRYGIKSSLDSFVQETKLPLSVMLLKSVQKKVASGAKAILVPSLYLKKIVEMWDIDSLKISVVYNAVPSEKAGIAPKVLEFVSHPRILVAGRLVPWKNIAGVIDAVSEIAGASLVVAGSGPDKELLENYARLKIPGRIVFLGSVAHRDLAAVMKASDVFVLNSSYEGFSHVLLEALLAGMPVIATRAGGNPELIRDGENGLLIEVGNTLELREAISYVLDNKSAAQAFVERAVSERKRFSRERMLADTAEFIRKHI